MNDDCGCCEGTTAITPQGTANRPGLTALATRVGTHAAFLETMKARLSSSDFPALGGLTARNAYDPAIALLDAWATVADVLTFYQERIANEGYLRTATERRSILELGRLVGYALRPGVAASVYLAYTLDPGAAVTIPVGTRAQSVPTPPALPQSFETANPLQAQAALTQATAQLPQSFETAEPLEARAAWNQLKVRQDRPQGPPDAYIPDTQGQPFYLQGVGANLKPGDPLLFDLGDNPPRLYRVIDVQPDPAANRVRVNLQSWLRAPDGRFRSAALPDTLQRLAVRDLGPPPEEQIRAVIARYRELEDFEVSRDSQMANRVLAALAVLDANPDELAAVLEQLRQEHATAAARRYTALTPWLGGLIADLTASAPAPVSANGNGAADRDLASLALLAGDGDSRAVAPAPGTGLGALIGPLQKNPSIPPPNSLRLRRNVATTFVAGSDVGAQVITTLDTRLKKTLYAAWERAPVTGPPTLESVQALRVKTAPFGHNAPLKPVLGANGAVVGSTEWPLFPLAVGINLFVDEEQISVLSALENDSEDEVAVQAAISVQWGAANDTRQVTLQPFLPPTNPRLTIGDFTVQITEDYDHGQLAFDFRDATGALVRQMSFTWGFESPFRFNDDTRSFQLISGRRRSYNLTAYRTVTTDLVNMTNLIVQDAAAEMVPDELRNIVALDAQYDKITPGSWVVIDRPPCGAVGSPLSPIEDDLIIAQVERVETVSLANYGITGKVTQLTLRDTNWLCDDDRYLTVLRNTTIYAQSEALPPALAPLDPITARICGGTGAQEDLIELDDLYDGLKTGRWLIVTGERVDLTDPPAPSGVIATELVMLAQVTQGATLPGDTVHTSIGLAGGLLGNGLAYCYKRDTVTIYGNVVRATHGETRTEVLGSGDASKPLPQFALRQAPLTYLAAPTPAGAASTLQVFVNDIRWQETDSLAGLGPTDRNYITQTDDSDKTSVIFGNGEHGARPPTGQENIKAIYRSGIGKPGNVDANQITMLASRPLGVRGVNNPLPATGGADREGVDQARRNVPLGVLALDRLVSVQDYADFARTFAGIGKASAARLSDGRRELVYVTIAGADDIPIDRTSDLYRNLLQALRDAGDPYQAFAVDLRELLLIVLSAQIQILPDYQWEPVVTAVRTALYDTFSFVRRDLGQDVVLGEVISAIQAVAGVAYVDVDVFGGIPERIADPQTGERHTPSPEEIATLIGAIVTQSVQDGHPAPRLQVNLAGFEHGALRPAQLALLTTEVPDTLILTQIP